MNYEKIEEMGVDVFLSQYSDTFRDNYLYKTPDDEIVCYFFFMTGNDFSTCFSSEAIKQAFERIPANDLFAWCRGFMPNLLKTHIDKCLFLEKWNEMTLERLVENWLESPEIIEHLLKKGIVSYKELYPPFESCSLSYIQRIYLILPRFVEKEYKMLLDQLQSVPYIVSTDILSYVM